MRSASLPREAEYIKQFADKWQKKGRGQYVCLSPLRTERTPSFYVWEGGRSGWHDFGTGESGDLFKFVERKNNCSFREAVDELARFCGLPTWDERAKTFTGPTVSAEELMKLWNKETTDRQIFQALTDIIYVCHAALPDKIRDYLNDNYGLDDEFIDLEKIGYCPAGLWKGREILLPQHSDEVLLATGFFHKESGTPIFSQRIIFPYWKDSVCRYAIARQHNFGLPPEFVEEKEWDKAKYKKLSTFDPEKRPYVAKCINNDILWGEDCLRNARGQVVYVTEGVTDAAMLRQIGFNAISPVTIRFRQQDIDKITSLLVKAGVKEVVILNDADVIMDKRTGQERYPGLEGAKQMAAELWRAKIKVRIGRLPKPENVQKIDVNEVGRDAYRRGGETEALETFRKITAEAELYPDFLVSQLGGDKELVTNEALGEALKGLAAVAVDLTKLQQADLLNRVWAKTPKTADRGEAKKAFKAAVQDETVKRNAKMRAETADPEPTTGGNGQAAQPVAKKPRKPAGKMGKVVGEEFGYYESGTGEDAERISTFSLALRRRVFVDEQTGDLLSCRVISIDGDTLRDEWVVPRTAWHSKKSFLNSFTDTMMQWTGDDNDVQRVAEILTHAADYKTVPRCGSTSFLGRYGEGSKVRFVLTAGAIDASGTWMENPDVLYAAKGGPTILERLSYKKSPIDTPEIRQLAKRFFEEVTIIHEPIAMTAIVGWWMSSLFRPFLMKKLKGHPILNVFAKPGSGKTSLLSCIWPAFAGVTQTEALSCASTDFMLILNMSSSNAVGLWYDEYRNDTVSAKFHSFIRNVYNGSTESRGRPNQDSTNYIMLAPVCISGETQMCPDQAMIERCAYVGLDGNWIREHPENKKRWDYFKDQPWYSIAPFLQAWSLRVNPETILGQAQILTRRTIALLGRTNLQDRVLNMLVAISFGLIAFSELTTELEATVPAYDLVSVFRELLSHSLDEDASGTLGYYVRDNFDDFLVDASTMANLRLIQEETHYVEINRKICLWVPGIEAVRSEWRRGQNLPMTSPGARALKKIAGEKLRLPGTYITAVNKQVSMDTEEAYKKTPGTDRGEARPYCIEFDPSLVPSALGLNPFPVEKSRLWGKKQMAVDKYIAEKEAKEKTN